jgi:putative selenate reductase FAD-binding subunit
MIIEYYRPNTLEAALALLKKPNTIPLAGGTHILTKKNEGISVVDLQALGLENIIEQDSIYRIGSATKLQQLFKYQFLPEKFKEAIKLESPLNLRNMASLGGLIVTCDGRSSIATSLLSMDARIIIEPGQKEIRLSDFILDRSNKQNYYLLVEIRIPILSYFNFEYVARTPTDRPIVCAALSKWENGRVRLTLGGFGAAPLLVLDGLETDDFIPASQAAFSNAEDEWASAEFRSELAGILTKRCIENILDN